MAEPFPRYSDVASLAHYYLPLPGRYCDDAKGLACAQQNLTWEDYAEVTGFCDPQILLKEDDHVWWLRARRTLYGCDIIYYFYWNELEDEYHRIVNYEGDFQGFIDLLSKSKVVYGGNLVRYVIDDDYVPVLLLEAQAPTTMADVPDRATTSRQSATEKISFESLPQELRDMIYYHVSEDTHASVHGALSPFSSTRNVGIRLFAQLRNQPFGLLLVSKSIRREFVKQIVSKVADLGVALALSASDCALPPPIFLERLSQIQLDCYNSEQIDLVGPLLSQLLSASSRLKKCRLSVVCDKPGETEHVKKRSASLLNHLLPASLSHELYVITGIQMSRLGRTDGQFYLFQVAEGKELGIVHAKDDIGLLELMAGSLNPLASSQAIIEALLWRREHYYHGIYKATISESESEVLSRALGSPSQASCYISSDSIEAALQPTPDDKNQNVITLDLQHFPKSSPSPE